MPFETESKKVAPIALPRLADRYGRDDVPHPFELLSANLQAEGESRVSVYDRCGGRSRLVNRHVSRTYGPFLPLEPARLRSFTPWSLGWMIRG